MRLRLALAELPAPAAGALDGSQGTGPVSKSRAPALQT